jgi:hypothetical protein
VAEVIHGNTYWFVETMLPAEGKKTGAHLLPNYDEYFIGFKDRSAIGEIAARAGIQGDDPSLLAHIIIIAGQVAGGWRRTLRKNAVLVELNPFIGLIAEAATRYGKFLGLPADVLVAS